MSNVPPARSTRQGDLALIIMSKFDYTSAARLNRGTLMFCQLFDIVEGSFAIGPSVAGWLPYES
jgi:hypothetical protein